MAGYNDEWCAAGISGILSRERPVIVIPEFSPPFGFLAALNKSSKQHVRAAGNVRVLLFGPVGRAAARKPTRPVATGTFAFPAFGLN
jgi:hypothetical protein